MKVQNSGKLFNNFSAYRGKNNIFSRIFTYANVGMVQIQINKNLNFTHLYDKRYYQIKKFNTIQQVS